MNKRNYDWIDELKAGDILRIRSVKEMEDEFGSLTDVPLGFTKEMREFCGKTIIFDKDSFYAALYGHMHESSVICHLKNYYISAGMCEIVNTNNCKEELTKDTQEAIDLENKKISIRNEIQDQSIIEEMISKVDRERFVSLVKVYNNRGDLRQDIIDEYLNIWAKSKYDFYILMGRNLSVTEVISEDITETTLQPLINDLKFQYPKCSLFIDKIGINSFIHNSFDDETVYSIKRNKQCETFSNLVEKNGKVSKFFSKLFQDNDFDIALSKVLQNKKVEGTILISIDPYDYLTMSINRNDWSSCYNIVNGSFRNGGFCAMFDNSTLVSGKHCGIDFTYSYGKYSFIGNSKQNRMLIHIDSPTSSVFFGGAFGSMSVSVSRRIENIIKELFEKSGIVLKKYPRSYILTPYLNDNERQHFWDDVSYDCFSAVSDRDSVVKPNLNIPEIKCAVCGDIIPNERERLCGHEK